jgi:glucose/arabinose dehydrogenase
VKRLLLVLLISCISLVPEVAAQEDDVFSSRYARTFQDVCAVCHGDRLQGAAQGTPLVGVDLVHGDSVTEIVESITDGFADKGMPAWSGTLSDEQIKNMALFISEVRQGLDYADFKYDAEFTVPSETIETALHDYKLEVVAEGIDALPFSIAPLPDGTILLTEKKLGLSIISPDGTKSRFIEGTPQAYADTYIISVKQEWGNGWLHDVVPHPDYEDNGWVYLHFGDRCSDCNEASRASGRSVSMNTLVRGRIKDGRWVDEETLWKSDLKFYGPGPDLGAGGRMTFDDQGHVFLSVGLKGTSNFDGPQDLGYPWGKIHRLHDDGRIPIDNPFLETKGALHTIWTYGHRSPQGLEWRRETGELWGTEHGPRGGDEVNRLLPGRNYGWPLSSKGLNYNGSPVAYGKQLGIEFDMDDIEQPVVDLSPSPAVSSFIFYDGDRFPKWRNHILVGSLKAQSLYRIELDGNRAVSKEILFKGIARVRDIEIANNGDVLLLLENNSGSKIVRMSPAS